ncbi:MAG TPA: IclR family transcriptional regulator [Burkholderiaceae bacterium]|nr:IclR family transcriptional regulator [Burkholderiaceae bacterium]
MRRAARSAPPAPDAPRYQAPALEKGLDIVELLAGEPAPLTQNQIAVRLGRSASEIFRMLEVLERRGWIARGDDGGYATTLRLFELAHRHAPSHRLLSAALPEMRALADDTRQSNHLVVHHERRILVIAQVDSPEAMGFAMRQGAHFPFRADRVSPWVLTAFQPPERREALIAEMLDGDPDPPSRAALARGLARIRRRGWEERPSVTLSGIVDLCFPIFDAHGGAIATLVQTYLAQRDVDVTIPQARERQALAAARISARLGAGARR